MSNFLRVTLAIIFSLSLYSKEIYAGPFGDTLTKCMVTNTSPADRTVLANWMVTGFSIHPEIEVIEEVSTKQKQKMSKIVAAIMDRLMSEVCVEDFVNVIQYEDDASLQLSFKVLGELAGAELSTDPAVSTYMQDFINYMDKKKFEEAIKSHVK